MHPQKEKTRHIDDWKMRCQYDSLCPHHTAGSQNLSIADCCSHSVLINLQFFAQRCKKGQRMKLRLFRKAHCIGYRKGQCCFRDQCGRQAERPRRSRLPLGFSPIRRAIDVSVRLLQPTRYPQLRRQSPICFHRLLVGMRVLAGPLFPKAANELIIN